MTDQDIFLAMWHALRGDISADAITVELDGVLHCITNDQSPRPPGGWRVSWAWDQRHGKPWQAVLEEVVRRGWEATYYAMGL